MASTIQVTTREAATILGVSLRTAQRHARNGKLAAAKTGGRWAITLTAPAELDGFKADQVDRARDLIEQGGILRTSRPNMFTAVSSDGSTTYLVAAQTCSCPAGRRGRQCYHVAAVAIMTATPTRLAA